MIDIQITAGVGGAIDALLDLGVGLKEAARGMLNAAAIGARKRVQSRMNNYIGAGNGWLKRHVYQFRRSEAHYVVAAPQYKAEILETGGTINTKKKKYLTFKVNGEWRKAKSVTITPRHWFSNSLNGYENEPEYQLAIEKAINKITDKFNRDRGVS